MVHRVAGGMKRPQRRSLGLENLPVFNTLLSIAGLVLVYCGLGTELEQIGNPIDMVRMPVGDQRLMHRSFFLRQERLQSRSPCGLPFAGVDQYSIVPSANQVCICAWAAGLDRSSGQLGLVAPTL